MFVFNYAENLCPELSEYNDMPVSVFSTGLETVLISFKQHPDGENKIIKHFGSNCLFVPIECIKEIN